MDAIRPIVPLTCAACLQHCEAETTCRRCSTRFCSEACRRQGAPDSALVEVPKHHDVCKKIQRVGLEKHHAAAEAEAEAVVAARESRRACAGATCYICMDDDSAEPLVRGCACRGTLGHAHLSCLVKLAQTDSEEDRFSMAWLSCRTCKFYFKGAVQLSLAWRCWETYCARAADDWCRVWALDCLGEALLANGYDCGQEALMVCEAHVATLEAHFEFEDDMILNAQVNLAEAYYTAGRLKEAVALGETLHATCSRWHGAESRQALGAAARLAAYLGALGLEARRRRLLRASLPVAERVHGETSGAAMSLRFGLAMSLFRDGRDPPVADATEALALLQKSREIYAEAHGPEGAPTKVNGRSLAKVQAWLDAAEDADSDAEPAPKRQKTLRLRDVEKDAGPRFPAESRAQHRHSMRVVDVFTTAMREVVRARQERAAEASDEEAAESESEREEDPASEDRKPGCIIA